AEGYGYAMLRLEGNKGAGFATSGSSIDYKIFTDETEDNPEFFADMFLRYCNLPTPCLFNDNYKRLDKHTTEFTLLRGQWGTVEFSFWDWDEPPIGYDSEQIICQPAGKYWFNSYSIDAAPDQRVSPVLHASHPSGTCEVNFTIELVNE
ncbi:MAG: hypothetical protein MI685_05765, partial [Chlorobiales bacterium]|nr:hypothetical protein [Chlorobiales bacterium]